MTPRLPDARGHFGRFGGRFVLRAGDADGAAHRAGEGVRRRAARPRVPATAGRAARRLRRPSDAALLRGAAQRALRRRAHLAQARGPLPHRRPQDQQRARPGAARRAHEEAACDRRDRRRPAWRGHGHRRRAARAAVRGVHGHGGHRAPGAQRLPDAAARGQGHPGGVGEQDAEGRGERGAARLGHQRPHHVLSARLGARPASLSHDGARLPHRDRKRGEGSGPARTRQAAGRRRRLRGRRQQRHRVVPPVHRRPPGRHRRRRARRQRDRQRQARRLDDRARLL